MGLFEFLWDEATGYSNSVRNPFDANPRETDLFRAGHQGDNQALARLAKLDEQNGNTVWVDDALRRRNR